LCCFLHDRLRLAPKPPLGQVAMFRSRSSRLCGNSCFALRMLVPDLPPLLFMGVHPRPARYSMSIPIRPVLPVSFFSRQGKFLFSPRFPPIYLSPPPVFGWFFFREMPAFRPSGFLECHAPPPDSSDDPQFGVPGASELY